MLRPNKPSMLSLRSPKNWIAKHTLTAPVSSTQHWQQELMWPECVNITIRCPSASQRDWAPRGLGPRRVSRFYCQSASLA